MEEGPAGPELKIEGVRKAQFRTLLKKEKIFPGCLGCCQSEYVGPRGRELAPAKVETRVKFAKLSYGKKILAPINRKVHEPTG